MIGITIGMTIGSGNGNRTVIFDNFDRSDNASTLGTSTSGQVWTNNSGNIGINSNKAYMPNAGTSIATIDSLKSSVAVSFSDSAIQESSLFNGAIVRYSDSSNYVRIVLQATTIYIQRRQAGVTTIIATTSITRNDGDVYRVIADAVSVTVYKNGVNILTVGETFNATATKQGMIFSTTLARMDNFMVEAL